MPTSRPLPDGIDASVVEGGGLRLAALSAGRGGPPVVLIHGASGNARDFTFGTLQAVARGHAAVAFDRPGLGGSETPATGAEDPFVQAAAMAEAARRMGHDRPVLVGHSYGGSVALAWALAEPGAVRGLVLIAAPSQVWEGGVGLTSDLLANAVAGPVVAAAAPRVLPAGYVEGAARRVFEPQAMPPGYVERLGVERLLSPAGLRVNARQLTALKGHIRKMVPRYPGLPMPVELVHGDADSIVPLAIHSQPFAAQVPGARLEILPGIGHMPHHADPGLVTAAIARALARS
jgi:pimeloyl-ACP methyl ester carboxylesterase